MKRRQPFLLALFATVTFASAFLIFLVQPLVAKRIVPWYGGAPGVWTLCLAFYQTMLFAGYAWAHALVRLARPGDQLLIHGLALTLAVAVLPILPGEAWRPEHGAAAPTWRIATMLAANVGPPFFALAATGPLLQAWFARAGVGRSPYPLYALSNLGSLLGVVAYPFAIEPRLGVVATGEIFSLMFVTTAGGVLACALVAWHRTRDATSNVPARPDPVRPADAALWTLLSGSAVVLLMGISNEVCLDVASVPFLWVLPLGIYLATLVFSFGFERGYRRAPFLALAIGSLCLPMVLSPFGLQPASTPQDAVELGWHALRWSGLLLGACTLMHGELYRLRPRASSLTAFYLFVAGGGALGGLFAGALAPHLFSAYHELTLGLVLGGVGVLLAVARSDRGWLGRNAPRWRRIATAFASVAVLGYAGWRELGPEPSVVHRERNLFGVLRIVEVPLEEGGVARELYHGTTRHGGQRSDREDEPTAYYGVHTGIGIAFRERQGEAPWNVGVVGLGAGNLAAYGRRGDDLHFYEIDPTVARLAQRHFSYLERSPARIHLVIGDGRLSLDIARRAGAPRFDLLAVDAYSSDAVPVHLLTREAIALFLDLVKPSGLLALHVTSRHFDLTPVVARLGAEVGAEVLLIQNPRSIPLQITGSRWLFLSRDRSRLDQLSQRADRHWRGLRASPSTYAASILRLDAVALARTPLWTDDYSDLLGAIWRPGRGGRP